MLPFIFSTQNTNMFDLKAAADGCNRSVDTVRRYIKAGRLPAVRKGGKLYVKPEDLDTALSEDRRQFSDTAELKAWAQRMAAEGPSLNREQIGIIMAAFSTVLDTKQGHEGKSSGYQT